MAKNLYMEQPPRKKLRTESIPKSTPLHNAVISGKVHIVEKLLKSGADINGKMKDGNTPLIVAVRKHKMNCFHLLLDRGADFRIMDNQGKVPLHYAAQNGELQIMRRLLKLGSTINAQDGKKMSPLHLAIMSNQLSCARELLKAGASMKIQDCHSRTPMYIAISKGWSTAVKELLSWDGDVDVHGLKAIGAWNIAIESENMDCLKILLNAGVGKDLINIIEFNSLQTAAFKGNRDLWKRLLDKKPKALIDKFRQFKLFEATLLHNRPDYFDDLLEAGLDVHVKDIKSTTLLHLAAKFESELPLMKLLKFKLNANAQDIKGATPLHLACANQRLKQAVLLLDAGAKWDIQNDANQTMLWELLHSVTVSNLSDEQIPLFRVILERTNDGLPINHFTKQTAAHVIMDPIFWKQIDSSFELTKLVLSTQKTLHCKGRSIINHITRNLNHIGVDGVPLIQMCIERGAYIDSQDCDRIKNYPNVRDSLLKDVQICTQSIANHFNNCTLFRLYGHKFHMPIENLKITPKWNSWTIIEEDVRLNIEKDGYCDISRYVTPSVS